MYTILSNLSYSERPSILHERWPYCAPLAWTTLLRSFYYIVPFSIIYYYIYIYIRYEHEIITQQVYMFAFCSIDRIGKYCYNRHRTVHDEGPQRTISPCPLSASIITCLKCANDPRHQRPVSVFIRYIRGNWNPPKWSHTPDPTLIPSSTSSVYPPPPLEIPALLT